MRFELLEAQLEGEGHSGTVREGDQYGVRVLVKNGDKPANVLLLIHGLGNSADFWRPLMEEAALSVKLVAPDIPGFGRSRDAMSEPFELDAICWRLASALRDEIATARRVILVGHSMGAYIALRLAVLLENHPDSVVLLDGTLFRAQTLLANRGWGNPRLAMAVAAQFVGGALPLPRVVLKALESSSLLRRVALWPYAHRPERLNGAALASALQSNGGLNVLRVLGLVKGVDLGELARATSVPVHLLWGQHDRLIADADIAIAEREFANVASAQRISDTGHWPLIESPQRLAVLLMDTFD